MRFLFTATPLTGHLLPMLPLARAAARAGHEVVIASGPDLAPDIRSAGLTAWSVGPSMAQIREAMATSAGPEDGASEEQRVLASGRAMFIHPSGIRALELRRLTEDWRPDAVVSELYELGGGLVECTTGLHVVHGLGADYPRFDHLTAVGHAELAALLGLADRQQDYLSGPYVDPFPAALQPPVRPWRDVRPIRPDIGEVPAGLTLPESFRRLTFEHTVYLTLGTVFTSVDTWRGLLAAVAELPLNVIATTGRALDPAELGVLPANVAAERFVPQALVLPRCSAVVCHAGAGTVLGALSVGTPLVLLPMGADQFGNAAAIEGAGAGVVLPPGRTAPAQIRAALARVLGDRSYRRAARGLSHDIAALPSPDDVLAGILSEARATV